MRSSKVARLATALAAASALMLGLAACTTPPAADPPAPDGAATASAEPSTEEFDPALIVSDDAFFDSTAMSEADIQRFLEQTACRPDAGVVCLAHYRETTTDQPDEGPGHCDAYRGAAHERASRILHRVAGACGISPRALIVLLQKEQSLLTRPSAYGYERATGYGCPDTADCEQKYFGFFNQVYNAAWQFRQYTEHPDRAYRIGVVDVAFHPDEACGAHPVDIRNQATANLYNYTPYQPNAAAVLDPESGDGCSSWGNLNFWRLWWRWFGDPTAERFPGFLPACSRLVGGHPCPPVATIPAAPPVVPES
ncbi:hypothetical protein [Agromyces intestinalis]|uniref:hypothetical protein n=1 Tax=Agromyces intestinalis TaxID=2592652 RepID=UPI001AEF74E3|nr:hypothetical protein [Agromyces intestinalis]